MDFTRKKISADTVFHILIALILCLYSTTSQLINIILPLGIVRIAIIIELVVILLLAIISYKVNNAKLLILLIMMSLVYLHNNYYLQIKDFFAILSFISVLLICYLSYKKIKWLGYTFKIMEYVYLFYAICTIIFYFMPSFYLGTVVNLFPGTRDRLIRMYNSGCMAGLTYHYSMNAMFISVGLVLKVSKLFGQVKKSKKDIIILVLMIIALLLTGKRGHIIFVAMSIFITFYFYLSNNKKSRLFKFIGIVILTLFVGSIAISVVPAFGTFVTRFKETMDAGDITLNRTLFWELALKLFRQNPILGIGWSRFQIISADTFNYLAHTHNIYIQLLCETGIVGIIIYGYWMISMLIKTINLYKKSRKSKNNINGKVLFHLTFSLCFQFFFLLYGITGNPLYDKEMYIPYFIACAISIYYRKKLKDIINQNNRNIGDINK